MCYYNPNPSHPLTTHNLVIHTYLASPEYLSSTAPPPLTFENLTIHDYLVPPITISDSGTSRSRNSSGSSSSTLPSMFGAWAVAHDSQLHGLLKGFHETIRPVSKKTIAEKQKGKKARAKMVSGTVKRWERLVRRLGKWREKGRRLLSVSA